MRARTSGQPIWLLVVGYGLVAGFLLHTATADVRIFALDNLDLGSWDGASNLQTTDDVCVYNSAGPNYLISAFTGGSDFSLAGSGPNLPFQVEFKGSSGSFTVLNYNDPTGFSSANEVSTTCGGSTNATIRVTIFNSDVRAVPAGGYSASLSIQVDPG